MHQHSAWARRWQMGLREGVRALAARTHRGDDPYIRDINASRSQWRVTGQCGRGEGVAGGVSRLQAEGGALRAKVPGGVLGNNFTSKRKSRNFIVGEEQATYKPEADTGRAKHNHTHTEIFERLHFISLITYSSQFEVEWWRTAKEHFKSGGRQTGR